MFPKKNPVQTQAWKDLRTHFDQELKTTQIRDLFANDPARFSRFSIQMEEILFDFSKNIITEKTISLLLDLAAQTGVPEAMEAMFTGEKINETEVRAVLHTALRNFSGQAVYADGVDVMGDIQRVQAQMDEFCEKIHSGAWLGFSGKKIKYVVNIGIGGSDLGPVMVTEALKPYRVPGINSFFVSNVDGTQIVETLKNVNPEETLFLIASKTFTTQETMTNAFTARQWFLDFASEEAHIAKHFVALSTNETAVVQFGIDRANMFEFWDWVGGRYSLWSAIGLSIALTVGYANFRTLLQGAHAADLHFRHTAFEKNIRIFISDLAFL